MITKAQMRENLKTELGGYLLLKGMDPEKLLDFLQKQVMEYCKPDCLSCYDKAYSTNYHGVTASADLLGDKTHETPMRVHILYCHCQRGKELKKLIEENYEPKP